MIDPQQTAREHLRPDEHLYWAGTGDPAKVFTGRDAFLIPFSLLWCGIIASSFIGTRAFSAMGPAAIVPLVFLVVGVHLLVGRFLVKRHRKRTTVYAVTDRRAVIISPRSTREVPIGRSDRTTTWSGGRRWCTVEWEDAPGGFRGFLGGSMQSRIYGNTGLDGLFGPQPFAFYDVRDGEELVRALDRVAR